MPIKNYKSILISVLLCIITPSLAFGAETIPWTVRGKVLEEGTRRPLEGITVFLEERDMDSATTGQDGSFTLTVGAAGEFSLAATGMGYKKSAVKKITTGGAEKIKDVELFLTPIYSMMEVVVKGDRNQDKTAKTVVSGKELMSVAGSGGDPLRGMQSLPGITTANDASSNPAIRGSGPEDNFYFVDFMPVGYLFHMGGLVSVLNADLVDDFNIYSSAFGPEFPDVTGGIIDVKLRDPRKDRIGGKASISLLEADALVEGPVSPDQSFYLGARRSYFDLLVGQLPEQKGVKITQFPEYYDYQGKYLWKLSEDHTLMFQMSGARDQMKLTLSSDSKEVKQDPVLAGEHSMDVSYNTEGVQLVSRLSPRVNNQLGVSYLNSMAKFKMGQMGYVNLEEDTVYLREHLNIAAGTKHDVLVGLDGGLAKIDLKIDIRNDIPSIWNPDTDFTTAPPVTYDNSFGVNFWGLSLKDRWKIADPVTLVIGQRSTYEDYFHKYKTEPRLGVEYSVTQDTLLTAGWGKYHQFPAGNEVIAKLGNPELSYLQADHYVLGAEHQLTDGWSAKLEWYFKRLYNLPVPDPTVNYINGGSGRAYGTELLIKKSRTTNWWGWVSAAYAKTVRHNDLTGERFPYPYDQPYIVNLVYNWKISPKWTFGAKWRYQTGAPFTPVVGTYIAPADPTNRIRPIYGPIGSERLPSYHRLDLRLSAEVWSGLQKVEFFVELINAYNAKNVSGYSYNEDYTSREPVTQLPLLPSVGIRMEF